MRVNQVHPQGCLWPAAENADGSGYAFWAEQVIALNKLNPQVAARLVRTLDHWKKYQPALKKQMQAALQKVAAAKGLSKDVQEVVFKTLG
jgi:aminopeptidase N